MIIYVNRGRWNIAASNFLGSTELDKVKNIDMESPSIKGTDWNPSVSIIPLLISFGLQTNLPGSKCSICFKNLRVKLLISVIVFVIPSPELYAVVNTCSILFLYNHPISSISFFSSFTFENKKAAD